MRKSSSTDRNRMDLLIDALHPEFKTMFPKPKKTQKFQPFHTQSRDLLLTKTYQQKDSEKDSVIFIHLEKTSGVSF